MKKHIFVLATLLLSVTISRAQSPMELLKERQEKMQEELKEYNEGIVDTAHRYFYKSYSDYVAGKPVTEIKYTGKRKILVGSESVMVLENDEFIYKKIKELKYWGFIDECGQLERIFDNHCYYVLDTGKICSYVKAIDVEMTTDRNGTIRLNWLSDNPAGFKDYISSGLAGAIEDFTDKKFETLTVSHPDVFEQYMLEAIDNSAKDKRNRITFKIQKYVRMFNGKK